MSELSERVSVVVGSVVTPESAEKCCVSPGVPRPPAGGSSRDPPPQPYHCPGTNVSSLPPTVVIALVCVSRPGPSPSHLAINLSTLFPCTSVVYLPWTLISTDLLDPVPSLTLTLAFHFMSSSYSIRMGLSPLLWLSRSSTPDPVHATCTHLNLVYL
jgi:hypothetical protein